MFFEKRWLWNKARKWIFQQTSCFKLLVLHMLLHSSTWIRCLYACTQYRMSWSAVTTEVDIIGFKLIIQSCHVHVHRVTLNWISFLRLWIRDCIFCLLQLFGESDRDTIVELARNISLASIGLAFVAGIFYFAGVISIHVHEYNKTYTV